MNSSPRGALVVLEGCDRSGKTTQCKRLVKALNAENIDAEYCRFPGESPIVNTYAMDKL